MEFRATVSSDGFRIFAGALQVLAALGDTITLELHNGQLVMNATNLSNSAQGVVHFSRAFFKEFELYRGGSSETVMRCSIGNNSLFNVVKADMYTYRSIDDCEIHITQGNIDAEEHIQSRFYLTINYKNGVTKKNTLWYAVARPIVMFSRTQYESNIICPPQLLKDYLTKFDNKTREIELVFMDNGLIMQTHSDSKTITSADPPVKATFFIHKRDFGTFDVKRNCKLIINLKEFKLFVDYMEYVSSDLHLAFEEAGKPVLSKFIQEGSIISYMALQTVPPHIYNSHVEQEESSFVDTHEDMTPPPSHYQRSRSTTRNNSATRHLHQRNTSTPPSSQNNDGSPQSRQNYNHQNGSFHPSLADTVPIED